MSDLDDMSIGELEEEIEVHEARLEGLRLRLDILLAQQADEHDQSVIAELEEANVDLHDSLDFAEALDDEQAIEMYGSLDARDEAVEAFEAAIQANLDQIAELEG